MQVRNAANKLLIAVHKAALCPQRALSVNDMLQETWAHASGGRRLRLCSAVHSAVKCGGHRTDARY
jgi:hypothetical protein